MSWREKLIRLMYGRYGRDTLNTFLFVCTLICLVLSSVFRFVPPARAILSLLSLALMSWYIFRTMSRSYARRQAENRAFLRVFGPIRDWFSLQYRRVRDCRSYVYRRCPECRAVLRLPRRAGRHTVRCPRCSHTWETRVSGNARKTK